MLVCPEEEVAAAAAAAEARLRPKGLNLKSSCLIRSWSSG